jgi:hypothetical protein
MNKYSPLTCKLDSIPLSLLMPMLGLPRVGAPLPGGARWRPRGAPRGLQRSPLYLAPRPLGPGMLSYPRAVGPQVGKSLDVKPSTISRRIKHGTIFEFNGRRWRLSYESL